MIPYGSHASEDQNSIVESIYFHLKSESSLHEASDPQLLELAQQGEADAFGELYYRHAKSIFRFIYTHVNDLQDAEDLTEEVFLKTWRYLAGYRHQDVPFLAYLFKITRNVLIDYYRRSAHSKRQVPIDECPVTDTQSDPDETTLRKLEIQELRNTLEKLREDYRTVLVLRFISGLSSEETSEVMGRSTGAIRILQHRALSALRNLLDI